MKRFLRAVAVALVPAGILVLAALPLGTRDPALSGSGSLFRLIGPDIALARIRFRTISPDFTDTPVLQHRGNHILVSGHIACDAGERVHIRATVVQLQTEESAGAFAEGTTVDLCAGENTIQPWVVRATIRGGTDFEFGAVRVCALATTRGRGKNAGLNDAWQWCRDLPLE